MTEIENIYGLQLQPEKYDVLMQKHVTPELRDKEVELMTRKWWDYRFLHPTAATYLFADAFRKEFKNAFARYFDYRTAKWKDPIRHDDLFRCAPGKINGLWQMRQGADTMCAPYELYARWAIDCRMRYWHRAWLPQPHQLLSDLVLDLALEKWNDHQEGVLMYGKHDTYRMENYAGLPVQDAHHEWLLVQAAKRPDIRGVLRQLTRLKVLPAEKIEAKYGREVTSRVLEAA